MSKTALVVSVVFCGALAISIRAQEPDEGRPRPRPRQQATNEPVPRPAPEDAAAEPSPPAESVVPQRRFAGPPGLSEEAIRSFTEIPPSASEVAPPPREPRLPEEGENPFGDMSAPPLPSRTIPARIQPRPEYIVEPPDMLIVEVLESLPGRPISGERLVRPDGRISLGFYGEVAVAGLTLPQIKERIVLHLRKHISDEILGLLQIDEETGEHKRDANGRLFIKNPRDTDRVFVDVTAYNSQASYVEGDVLLPGRFPYTGGDTVLDLLHRAAMLLPTADKGRIRLVRSFPKGSSPRMLPVNYHDIVMGIDSSTNYAILPGDRLVVPGGVSAFDERTSGRLPTSVRDQQERIRVHGAIHRAITDRAAEQTGYFNRELSRPEPDPNAELERRIDELEQKLDRLIKVIEQGQPKPGGPLPGRRAPAAESGEPFEPEPLGPPPPGPRLVAPAGPRPRAARSPRRAEPRKPATEPAQRIPDLPDSEPSPFDAVPSDRPPE